MNNLTELLKKTSEIVKLLGILGVWNLIFIFLKKNKKQKELKKAKFMIRLVEKEIWITNKGLGEARNIHIRPLAVNTAVFNNPSPIPYLSSKNKIKLRIARCSSTPMQEEFSIIWEDDFKKENIYVDTIYY